MEWAIPYYQWIIMVLWIGGLGIAPPKFNGSPLQKWWLEDDPFLLGFGNFSGANC